MHQSDVLIIGGGIVGLATAYRLTERYPDKKVIVIEKESELGSHQTGHNSGVLHSGIYYKPGSLRAKNCRSGKLAMEAFCDAEGIEYDLCGKVIVAFDDDQVPLMRSIYERGQANGVKCELIDRGRLAELEPHAAGVAAIHVPEAGIVNFRQVNDRMAERVRERGGQTVTGAKALHFQQRSGYVVVETTAGEFGAHQVVNCAGLYCDRVTRLSGQVPEAKILPFRGEFFELKPAAHHLCRTLIYPVPDPDFPFLGVHFTRVISGGVECGPNAVLAFAREGYEKTDLNLRDLAETLSYGGFLRMAAKYWRTGLGEMYRSASKAAFVRALQKLVPEIREDDLTRPRSGVRAQAISPEGNMVDDFLIQETAHVINVGNAPSPAATASLNIGKMIVDRLAERFS